MELAESDVFSARVGVIGLSPGPILSRGRLPSLPMNLHAENNPDLAGFFFFFSFSSWCLVRPKVVVQMLYHVEIWEPYIIRPPLAWVLCLASAGAAAVLRSSTAAGVVIASQLDNNTLILAPPTARCA
jgi:hypothetical protein